MIFFETGERVRVTDGPFEGFAGMVEGVDQEQQSPQGVGVDFRPGDPGRAGVCSICQGVLTHCPEFGGRRGRRAGRTGPPHEGPEGRDPRGWTKRPHGQESHRSLKLQVPAGKANPSPPVGPALGERGINIMAFCKAFNAADPRDRGRPAPPGGHHLLHGQDSTMEIKTPPASDLLKKAAKCNRGSKEPGKDSRRGR